MKIDDIRITANAASGREPWCKRIASKDGLTVVSLPTEHRKVFGSWEAYWDIAEAGLYQVGGGKEYDENQGFHRIGVNAVGVSFWRVFPESRARLVLRLMGRGMAYLDAIKESKPAQTTGPQAAQGPAR